MPMTLLMPRLPLRMRLMLVTALLSGITMTLFGLGFYRVLKADLLRGMDNRLAVAAQELSELSARTTSVDGPRSQSAATVPEDIVTPGIGAKLITPDGQSRDLSVRPAGVTIPDDPTLTAAAEAGAMASGTVQVQSGEHMRLLATPVGSGQQARGVLVVGESLQGTQRILAKARSVLLGAAILIPALVTAGVGLLMDPALRAISTLTQRTAEVVVSENYRTRVAPPAQRGEIFQLTATINDLISTVQRTLDQKRQFLAFTSHELRSPLTVILANLDLLRRDLTPEERTFSVTEAMEEARRMRRLVNDLLLLAEKDSTQVVERTPMRLDSLIEETVAVLVRQDETHSIHVHVAAPVVVEGDAERLMQVVRNLVENALMHTPAGTLVDVRLEQVHGYARITVADTGPGIPAEHLPHLWDRFYRVDKARSREKGSTGLGLPIVKYIAEAHGGSVDVASTPGQGTSFTVLLPLAPQLDRSTPAATEAATV